MEYFVKIKGQKINKSLSPFIPEMLKNQNKFGFQLKVAVAEGSTKEVEEFAAGSLKLAGALNNEDDVRLWNCLIGHFGAFQQCFIDCSE